MSLTVSDTMLKAMKAYEGCPLKTYPDSKAGGKLTIGYGFTGTMTDGRRVVLGLVITQEFADIEIRRRIAKDFAPGVINRIKRQLKQHEFDALVDIAYNRGSLNQDLVDAINRNDKDGIICAFMRIVTGADTYNPKTGGKEVLGGLIKRRANDVYFFFKGDNKDELRKKIIECTQIANKGYALSKSQISHTKDVNWENDKNFKTTQPVTNYDYANNSSVNAPVANRPSAVKTEIQTQQKNIENNYNGVFLFSSNHTPATSITEKTKQTKSTTATTQRNDVELKQIIESNATSKDNPNTA